MISREYILSKLPPFLYDSKTIVRHQSVKDLIKEIINAHKAFAADYDNIAFEFGKNANTICRRLFTFCQAIPYQEEPGSNQTSRSPAAMLTMPYTTGTNDCKHYAGFIAGVLDAFSRAGSPIEWYYRFCTYEKYNSAEYNHVFVVVILDGEEYWLDPTPIGDLQREFNDRFVYPKSYTDKTVSMITRMSGVNSNIADNAEFQYFSDGGYTMPSGSPEIPVATFSSSGNNVAEEMAPNVISQPLTAPVQQGDITVPDKQTGWDLFVDFVKKNPGISLVFACVIFWAGYEASKHKIFSKR